jgi:hypothetical protein
MKIVDFISILLPRFNKSTIMDDVRITQKELSDGSIPAYTEAALYFKSNKFKSDKAKDLNNIFYRNFDKKTTEKNFVLEITKALPNVLANLNIVNEKLEDTLEADVIKDGMSAVKTILVRAADQISFISRHSVNLLTLVYAEETNVLHDEGAPDSFQLTPMQIKTINKDLPTFASLLAVYSEKPEEFAKKLLAVPDIIVNSKNYSTVSSAFKESDIDPFGTGLLVGFDNNPIYRIRMLYAEWQADRYAAFKDKKRMLELRLLNLKNANSGKADMQVEKEIDYLQSRIDTLEYKMAKIEGV